MTTPTQLPVPSEKPQDLKFNAGKIDEFVTSLALQYIDRLGGKHYTIEGLKELVLQHIYNLGWNPVGTFQGGATVANAGDIVQDTNDDTWYRWDDLATLPKTVPVGSTPGSTGGTGDGKWQPVDVSDVLRKDLAKPSGASLSGFQNGQPSSVPTTVGNKLRTSIDLAVDFVDGGVISGQPDLTANLQAAIVAAFNLGLSEVSVVGDFKISSTILLYPGVTLKGGGYDKTVIRCSDTMPAGTTMIRSHRPSGWVPGCNNIGLDSVYLVGRAAKDIHAVDFGDCNYFHLYRVRTDLFDKGISFNRWIDEVRTGTSPNFTYPRALSPTIGGQAYFGKIELCAAIDCVRGIYFSGVYNRNTEISCTWSACALAYDFSNPRGVYETNTFISPNVEGCKEVWSWFYSINSPYANTWITLSIDNGNEFTCQARDGGRQTFINLSLFPYSDPARVNWILDNPNGHRSTVLGTDIGENLGDYQLKTQFREELHSLAGIYNKIFGSGTLAATIAGAGGTYTTSIIVPNLPSGSAVCWSVGQLYPGVIVQVAAISAGEVNVQVVNVGSGSVTINTTINVTGISKSFL